MIRNFKALGLALVAVLALSTVGASGAQAQLRTTTTGPTWLTFDSIGTHVTTFGSVSVPCTSVAGHATVVNNQTEVTATNISYSGCTSSLPGTVATVTMNGCDYKFHGGVTDPINSEHGIEGEMDLVCPGGGPVIHIYASAAKHAAGETLCKLTIAPFTNKKEITYTNTAGTPNDFDLKMVSVPISITKEGSILCPASGAAKTDAEITMTGFKYEGVDLSGHPIEGVRTGVTVS